LLTVSDSVCVLPTTTLPKLRLAGFAPKAPGATPVPDTGMVRVGLDALEVRLTLPEALPAADGANETLKVVLWPAVRVSGTLVPLRLNPVPPAAACEMVTLVPPVLVTVSDSVCVLPTTTLPKLRLVGFAPKAPGATPVPDSGMVRVGLDALEVRVTLPEVLPAADGANETLKVVLWPAVKVIGKPGEVREKYLVEMAMLEMVTDPGPALVTPAVRVLVLPAATLPKSRAATPIERVPVGLEEPTLNPWHPTRNARPATRSRVPAAFDECSEQLPFGPVLCIVSHGPETRGSTTVCTLGAGSS